MAPTSIPHRRAACPPVQRRVVCGAPVTDLDREAVAARPVGRRRRWRGRWPGSQRAKEFGERWQARVLSRCGPAAAARRQVPVHRAAGLPGRRDPRRGQDDVCAQVAAELLADRTVDAATVVVPTEHLKHQWSAAASRVGIALDPEVLELDGADVVGVPRRRRHLRAGRQPPDPAPGAHREPPHSGDLRRDPPRRRREELGRRHPRGVRATRRGGSRSPARRSAATTARSRSSPTSPTATGCCARAPTTPTATPRRSPTASCGRSCSWPTPARRAGATAPARSTRRASASR